ncbi:putative protein phosphatase 2C 33 isoform X1 [Canna indica]|uniref:protein-serine/threonine phosphatase n=1 Tax=Canna indica TaxID=4628 RepID=A0AAQ3KNN4_9LILI|nr:putative protein phosphatase 2C 33 isoform X1 [Canna indica]
MGSCLSSDGQSSSSGPSSPSSSPAKRPWKGARRTGPRSSSRREEQQLHKIPGRMFFNGASEVASLFTQQGRKGINQDAMIVWENFGSRNDTVFCGVFDGHGPYGHMVSKRVRDILPLKLNANWEEDECRETTISNCGSINSEASSTVSLQEEPRISTDFEENDEYSQMYRALKGPFLKTFRIVDRDLRHHPDIDCFYSGTTAVTLVKQGNELVIGNVGDSRAVLGTRDHNNSLLAVQLTVDLKPNLPSEAERIRKSRGRVFALRDEPEVARVWLPNNDVPGLAMARALGDFCLKDFGLISVPEISYWHITERDEFVVLATDGVWDVLSNKDVVDIVASAPARSSAAQLLVEWAVKAWRFKYPTSRIDDCAVVCLFLNADASKVSSNHAPKEVESPTGNDKEHSGPISFDRVNTIRSGTDILQDENGSGTPELHSNDINSIEGDNFSVQYQQGVARVDTLLSLPRFVAQNKQQTSIKT